MTSWGKDPAWAAVLAKLAELAARIDRIHAERKRRSLVGIVTLAARDNR